MMEELELSIAFLVFVIVLPLLPAYLLFKYLPAPGRVEGPLKGLNIRFSGAFAGYLVLFFSLLLAKPNDFTHYHIWTVTGRVEFQRAPGEDTPNVRDVVIRLLPPHLILMNEGSFSFQIPVMEDENGNSQFPDLQIDLPWYEGKTFPLGATNYGNPDPEIEKAYDPSTKRIAIKGPITLRSKKSTQPYAPTTSASVQQATVGRP